MKSYSFVLSAFKGKRVVYIISMIGTVLYSFITLLPTVIIGKIVDNVLYNGLNLSNTDRRW